RTWRHLDTMQFATYLHCNVPRVRCEKHDVKSIRVPWAEKNVSAQESTPVFPT
ncbi:transposase family protein, partial [Thiolapillus sp.]|uniref:transposase family protein n=1 Tax=Thiolapillus sp. TaxID=2017437 RepID=UPI003AF97D27